MRYRMPMPNDKYWSIAKPKTAKMNPAPKAQVVVRKDDRMQKDRHLWASAFRIALIFPVLKPKKQVAGTGLEPATSRL